MKKIVSLLLVLTFVCLAFISCGAKSKHYNYDLSEYIDLAEYKNIPAETPKAEVTDDEVEEQIMATINYYARKNEVTDRPAQSGDYVTVDYAGYVDGVSTNTVSISNTEVAVGLGTLPEEFENALIGMNKGDTKSIEIVLPDPFEEYPNYAGKTANLVIAVKSVCELESPVYNDDFARAYLGYDSVEEFEKAIRASIEKQQALAFYGIVVPQVWQTVFDNTEVKKYPENEVKAKYDTLVGAVAEYVETLNLDMDAFIEKNFEMTAEEYYDLSLEQAQMEVKERMICHAIAKAEGIKVTNAEYEKRALEYAEGMYGLESIEALEEQYTRDEVEELVLCDIVKEFLADNASITYTED